jgi:hypothetical protein
LTSTPFDSSAVDAAGKRKLPFSKRLYHRQCKVSVIPSDALALLPDGDYNGRHAC